MAVDEEARAEAQSVAGSIDLDLEDRLYLEAQKDPKRIANTFSRGPQRLGFWSIVCIIINRMMGIFDTLFRRGPAVRFDRAQVAASSRRLPL